MQTLKKGIRELEQENEILKKAAINASLAGEAKAVSVH
jgi:hypothetical protein